MAGTYDIVLSGDQQKAKDLIAQSLTSQGFTVESTPKGGYLAKRGSRAATFWLGAMAGKNFQVTFIVEFFTGDGGSLVARLSRNLAAGALKGGAIGANKTNNAFIDTANALVAATQAAGVFTSSTSA
jgi:hypothetical protein